MNNCEDWRQSTLKTGLLSQTMAIESSNARPPSLENGSGYLTDSTKINRPVHSIRM